MVFVAMFLFIGLIVLNIIFMSANNRYRKFIDELHEDPKLSKEFKERITLFRLNKKYR